MYTDSQQERKLMNQAVAKSALAGCLAPIDKKGLDGLIAKGTADPKAIKTLKCTTAAEGRFRHLNFIRNLPAYVVDEPQGCSATTPRPTHRRPRSPRSAHASRSASTPTRCRAALPCSSSRSS